MIAAHAAGIRVFATGGIGGVHRGALGGAGSTPRRRFDISSDLEELGRTPMAVVCAGPKAILDVPGDARVPRDARRARSSRSARPSCPASTRGRPGSRRRRRSPDVAAAAALVAHPPRPRARRRDPRLRAGPGRRGAARRGRPRRPSSGPIAEADAAGVHGPALTPWLLARIADADRRRVGPRQHRPHRQRRPGRRSTASPGGRRSTRRRACRRHLPSMTLPGGPRW